mmetsp:Transcript_33033/g.84685  ORF Transcript_33033/g.84685 Transcript_33033/m.84685 type:complete len:128 (-) Transcript_33033:36-419(-)
MSRDEGEVYVEMCVGMGETLASAKQPGTPYRFSYGKKDGKVTTLALASFSKSLVARGDSFELAEEAIDYSSVPLHSDAEYRDALVTRIAKSVVAIADARKEPQDVEGAVDEAGGGHIVQSRPMVLSD